ncbi:MAG: M28 family peptidase [bacterium]|nr:M28 family peptidase [bacterium]
MIVALCLVAVVSAATAESARSTASIDDSLADSLEQTLATHLRQLSIVDSRVTGYPGTQAAAELIELRLRQAGIDTVYHRPFHVPIPLDCGAEISIAEDRYELYSLWPNLARTSTMAGATAPLVYAGRARPAELDVAAVHGAIALLEYDRSDDWVRVFDAGAIAVILLASDELDPAEGAHRSESATHFLSTSADLPRFYAEAPVARKLRQAAPAATARLVARMDWRNTEAVTLVAVIPGRDAGRRHEAMVLASYYDAVSPVPARAPGADQASGVAVWLELARRLQREPPARTVVLVTAPGHFQALAGMRDFVDLLRQRLAAGYEPSTPLQERLSALRIGSVLCLDLSSHGTTVALQQAGAPYRVRTVRPALFDRVEVLAEAYESDRLGGSGILGGSLRPLAMRRELGQMPEPIPVDGAVASLAGFLGLTLVTAGDSRPLFDSPADRIASVDLQGLTRQARFLLEFIPSLICDADAEWQPARAKDSYGLLKGRFVTWGVGAFEPDAAVPGALVRVRSLQHVLAGVRVDPLTLTAADGSFEVRGVEARTLYLKPVDLEAYGTDLATGRIHTVVDRGLSGAQNYPARVRMDHNEEERRLVGFAAQSLILPDLFDPRSLLTLDHVRLLDGAGDADLERYGFGLPATAAMIAQDGYYDGSGPHKDRVGVLFVPPGRSVKVVMTSGQLGMGQRLLLLGGDDDNPFGDGISPNPESNIAGGLSAQVAADLTRLNAHRLADLESHGITSRSLRQLHETSSALALERDETSQRHAWSLAARAHTAIASLGADAVTGVLFVLLALLPFSVFVERLVFEARTIHRQVGWTVFVFLVAFVVLRFSHPAFDLTLYPLVVLIGFLILALSVTVAAIGLGRLNTQLRQSVSPVVARHRIESRRSAMAGRAFLLGVAHMRRRPLRTALTCTTLVLLSFSLVSFTAIRTTARLQVTDLARTSVGGVDAVLLRNPGWTGLVGAVTDHLGISLGGVDAAPRLWYERPGQVRYAGVATRVAAALGLTPQEASVTDVQALLIAGRWLSGARHECLLPMERAAEIGLSAADVGVASVEYFGEKYLVVGLFDAAALDGHVDVGGTPLTPLDVDAYQPEERRAGADRRGEAPAFAHLPARQILLLPAHVVAGMGRYTRLASVAAPLAGGGAQLERFAHTVDDNLFARLDGRLLVVDTANNFSMHGERGVWVPLAIAVLIVFNTMLGSVYERVPEIATFNSVGLAPNHVAGLFIAEAAAFATLGGVGGYLVAQVLSRIGLVGGLFPGLTVNFSSYSAVVTLAMVMALVVASAIYPARAAGRLCVPGVERSWQLPRPQADALVLSMPFSLRWREAVGLCRFIAEYLNTCDEQSIGAPFYAENVDTTVGGRIRANVWLAPFDSGVAQQLQVESTQGEDGYATLVLSVRRTSGDEATWLRANRHFVDGVRRQFLMWRALAEGERAAYVEAIT